MELRFSVRSTVTVLGGVVLAFLVLHALVWTLVFACGVDRELVWIKLFDLDSERNAPTLFSSLELLTCAALLAVIGAGQTRAARRATPWYALALIFLFLALDETAQLHEAMVKPLRNILHTSGLLYQAWVVPYALALLLLGLAYLGWYRRLPRRSRILFAVAGAVYVSGALFFEMVGGMRRSLRVDDPLLPGTYVLVALEEGLEMAGALVFLGALLDYAQRELGGLRLVLPNRAGGATPSHSAD